jgi:hypothetical protein
VFDNQEKERTSLFEFSLCTSANLPQRSRKKQHCHLYQLHITTTATFSEIRKQPGVEQLLKSYGAILQTTPLQAEVVETATLRWQMRLIPSYMTSTNATEHFCCTLEMNSGKAPKRSPPCCEPARSP